MYEEEKRDRKILEIKVDTGKACKRRGTDKEGRKDRPQRGVCGWGLAVEDGCKEPLNMS